MNILKFFVILKSRTLSIIVLFELFALTVSAQSSKTVNFSFHKSTGNQWQGTCPVSTTIFRTAIFTLSPATHIKSGKWRAGMTPRIIWDGVEVDSNYIDTTILVKDVATKTKIKVPNGYVDSSVEIEIYEGGFGVLRNEDGWYSIKGYSQSMKLIQFQVDTSQEVKPSELDREIIKRASAILFSDSVWNRNDNRKCDSGANQWSIYCAMVQATIDVTGGFQHRRPALQLVRQIVEERTANKNYHHRLMDYNNDPTTKLEDVQAIFKMALSRIH